VNASKPAGEWQTYDGKKVFDHVHTSPPAGGKAEFAEVLADYELRPREQIVEQMTRDSSNTHEVTGAVFRAMNIKYAVRKTEVIRIATPVNH
jgi:hypothetical protein